MQDEIKVHVVKYPDRTNLVMRYLDPLTNKHVAKSSGTANQKAAEREAAKWEDALQSGRYAKPTRMTWADFREYYSANALPGLSLRSIESYESTLDVFERRATPQRLADVTTARLTAFVTGLRADGRSEATIARHLRHLKAAMRWANKQGLLLALPVFTMPKRVKGAKVMRGRPITLEEFERMLAAVPAIVDNLAAESWKFYLKGLWASGLRLSESLTLRWDDAPAAIVVDLSGRRPMLRIPAEVEKGNQDRLLPITPEFATLLQSVPERERRGRVFKLLAADGTPLDGPAWLISSTVAMIGEKAGVVVDEREKIARDKDGKPQRVSVRKFASAHDLRRAFGQRWASKVMPMVLRELMRHASVSTTMAYYVGSNAEATADAIWATESNSQGNSNPEKTARRKRGLEKQSEKQHNGK